MKSSSLPVFSTRSPFRLLPHWNHRRLAGVAGLNLVLVTLFAGAVSAPAAGTVTVAPGWNLVANQCVNANTIATLFPTPPVGSLLLKADNTRATFEPLNVFSSGWSSPGQTLAPGEGAWFYNPTAGSVVSTLPGASATPQLPLVFSDCAACFLVSRQSYSIGNYAGIMGTAPPNSATVHRWKANSQSYETALYDADAGGWTPGELEAAAGESLWICPRGSGPMPQVPSFCVYTNQVLRGWNLIANQCINAGTVASLIPQPPFGTTVLKYNNTSKSFESVNLFTTRWGRPDQKLFPGEGAWLLNPGTKPFDVIIAGAGRKEGASQLTGPGCYLASRRTNATGSYLNIVGTAPESGSSVHRFNPNSQSFDTAIYDPDMGGWTPGEITAAIGEPLWICLGGVTPPAVPTLTGYTNVIAPGWNLVANQCSNDNTIPNLLPSPPFGTLFLKYENASASYDFPNAFSGAWSDPAQTLAPGEGAWLFNPSASSFPLVVSGSAGPGGLSSLASPGGYLISRKTAEPAGYADLLGGAVPAYTLVHRFNAASQSFVTYAYDPDMGDWSPSAPAITTGEAVWVSLGGVSAPAIPSLCGYTNTLAPGWSLIANECLNTNSVSALFPAVPPGTELIKFDNGASAFQAPNLFSAKGWKVPSQSLSPGEGAWIYNPLPTPVNVLLTGFAAPGGLHSLASPGCYLVSPKSAGPASYSTMIAGTPPNQTTAHTFNAASQSYNTFLYDADLGGWTPGEPTVAIGEPLLVCLGGGSGFSAPCYLRIVQNDICNLVTLSWPCSNCHLEAASALATPSTSTVWTTVRGTSPLTLPASGTTFYRLACP